MARAPSGFWPPPGMPSLYWPYFLRLALLHLLGRNPARPFLLVADRDLALELQAIAADRDAVAAGGRRQLDQIEEVRVGIDDDGAARIAAERHRLRLVLSFSLNFPLPAAVAPGPRRAPASPAASWEAPARRRTKSAKNPNLHCLRRHCATHHYCLANDGIGAYGGRPLGGGALGGHASGRHDSAAADRNALPDRPPGRGKPDSACSTAWLRRRRWHSRPRRSCPAAGRARRPAAHRHPPSPLSARREAWPAAPCSAAASLAFAFSADGQLAT